jgi:hypothetical protein
MAPVKVTLNGLADAPINFVSVFKTVMGLYEAPMGTVTVNEVEVPEITVALVAPK